MSDKVYKSVWDEVTWVVKGEDELGQEMMVWLRDGVEAYEEPISNGFSESAIRQQIIELYPGIQIVRLVPGVYNNQYVWQLFYKDATHHYYCFFDFYNGEPLPEVFTLPNR